MHILYVDDSGSIDNPNDRFFILGGVSVFERGIYHQITALENAVASFNLGDSKDIELHGSPMYQGRGQPWSAVKRPDREAMIRTALSTLGPRNPSVRLFAVAVERSAVAPHDPVEIAFEEICNRFNLYLQRRYHRGGRQAQDQQRGLIVMDQSKHEEPLQALASRFRARGTRWGQLRNLAEVPFFVDSRASRLVQAADLVAFATWRKYEHQDGRFFDDIIGLFDNDGGVIHGLVHRHRWSDPCFCPSCMSRTNRDANNNRNPSNTDDHQL